ncbi:hypothetical protein ISG33_08990 [Glaciecola sp. MH2013]|uniref:tetratricopeptide repeat protein n=1 Tax=Glaciecola sp. MH2013 TaxID=2785524 RepID=UPI00189D046B|nr:hypothetical protein [Glaciecola sp. MH2013]MBF7073529.1 hypothetical protein [Glaciecola sp. MH2013]
MLVLALSLLSFKSLADDAKASLKSAEVTEEQAKTAIAFVEALNKQNVDDIANFFDLIDFGGLVISKIDTEANIKRALAQQYRTTEFARTFIQSSFILPQQASATFKYRGPVKTELFGNRPMVRLDHSDGGHEFMLLFFNDANKIIDLFYASKGGIVSDSVAGTTQLLLPTQNRFIARLLGKEENSKETTAKFVKMLTLRNQGKFPEVLELIQTLPESIQSHRAIVELEVLIGQNVSDESYMNALGKLNTYFGDDPSTSFMLIDYHVTVGDNESAAKSVDKAIEFWGEDAALINLKANMLYLLGDNKAAIEQAKLGIAKEPNFEDLYWTLIALQDLEGDFENLTTSFREVKTRFNQNLTPQDVLDAGTAESYLASDEFKKVLAAGEF